MLSAQEEEFLNALDRLGYTNYKDIANEMNIVTNQAAILSKSLEEKGRVLRLRSPPKTRIRTGTTMKNYGIFEEYFTTKGHLVIKKELLDEFTEDLISCIPESMTEDLAEAFRIQVYGFSQRGLPAETCQKIKDIYLARIPPFGEYDREKPDWIQIGKDGKAENRVYSADVCGIEVMFPPLGSSAKDVWFMGNRVRFMSLNSIKMMEDIEDMSELYDSLKKAGYDLPNEDEFTKEFTKALHGYGL